MRHSQADLQIKVRVSKGVMLTFEKGIIKSGLVTRELGSKIIGDIEMCKGEQVDRKVTTKDLMLAKGVTS